MYLSIGTGKEPAIAVGHINFGSQSACMWIDGVSSPRHAAGEALSRKRWQFNSRAEARTDRCRVDLRNVYVNTNWGNLRDHEQFLARSAVAGGDQCADIGGSVGDDSCKRSINMLEGFELF